MYIDVYIAINREIKKYTNVYAFSVSFRKSISDTSS